MVPPTSMYATLTCLQKLNIYFSTMFAFSNSLMVVAIMSRIKHPISQEFNLSETFLGFIDGVHFFSSMLGYLLVASYPIKKPVMASFVISILLFLSMGMLILMKFTTTYSDIIFICSQFLCGLLRPYSILAYIVFIHYFKGCGKEYFIQIWYSSIVLGDIYGVLIPDFIIQSLQFDWPIAMLGALLLLLISGIYIKIAVSEIDYVEDQIFFCTMIDFMKEHWTKGINLLHSCSCLMSSFYYLMILWLPYFFSSIGYEQAGFISTAYPIAYIIGGLLFQVIQSYFQRSIGTTFLACLIISNVGTIWLTQLGDDSEEIIKYFILVFMTSILSSGFSIFIQSSDLNNRVNNDTRSISILYPANVSLMMIFYIIVMLTTGSLMEQNLHNLFTVYAVMIGASTILHLIRMIKYPDSFGGDEKREENEGQDQNRKSIQLSVSS